MVDSREIEQLRALAFASIPVAARKAQQSLGLSSKKEAGRVSVEREEGELSSEDDNAEATRASQSHLAAVSASEHLSVSNSAVKGKWRSSIVFESCPPITVETPGSATVVSEPITLSRSQVRGDSNLQGPSSAVVGKDENGLQVSIRTSVVKCRENNSTPQRLLGVPASLPSRTGSGLWPVGGIHKEADAFLAGLNIPQISHSSHRPAFLAEKNNSLVIKFSDEDSDSDGEQHRQTSCGQGQTGKNGVENTKSIGNGVLKTHLSNQTKGGLKSEIDRVRKQIAAIERIKGKPGLSTTSKSSGKSSSMDASKQVSSKPRNSSKSGRAQATPVDLESLRQKIAAKESELQLRKQRGFKELTNAEILSDTNHPDAAHELGQAINNSSGCLENSICHSESEGMREGSIDGPVPAVSEVNVVPNASDASYLKNISIENMQCSKPGHGSQTEEQNCSLTEWAAANINTTGEIPCCGSTIENDRTLAIAQPVEGLSMYNSIESVVSEKRQPSRQLSDGINTITKMSDLIVKAMCRTPKRKRNETELSKKSPSPKSERVKKQKRSESFKQQHASVPLEDSLRENIVQENPEHSTIMPPLSVGQPLSNLQPRGVSLLTQGITATVSPAMKSQQGLNIQEGEKVKMLMSGSMNINDQKSSSDALATEAAVNSSLGNEDPRIAYEFIEQADDDAAVSQSAKGQNNSSGGKLSSDQITTVPRIASLSLPRNGSLPKSNASTERQICRDVAASCTSYLSKAIIEMKKDTAHFSEHEKDLQGVIAGTSPRGLSQSVWTSEGQLQKTNLGIFQGLFEQSHEFRHDSLQQLQEEEDLIDKELEEAQQSRRRCEVREHLARRQYRDAQEALHTANLRCDVLYQKREALAARIKAAELQYLQNRAFLVPPVQQQNRTLVPLGFSRYPERASLGFETPLGVTEDHKLSNLPADHNINSKGSFSEPFSSTVKELPQDIRRKSQLDNHLDIASHMISDVHYMSSDPGSNGGHQSSGDLVLHNNNASGLTPSSGPMAQSEPNLKPPSVGRSSHQKVGEGEVEENNEAKRSISFINENSLVSESNETEVVSILGKQLLDPDRSQQRKIASVSTFTPDSCGLNFSALVPISAEGLRRNKREQPPFSPNFVEPVHGHVLEKECSHGFSSASFARDLGRRTSNTLSGHKDAIGNNGLYELALEGECVSNQDYSSHNTQPVSRINMDTSCDDGQRVTKDTETVLGMQVMDASDLACYSKALCTVPIDGSDYASKSGTSVAEGKGIDLTYVDLPQLQHFDDARGRAVLCDNEEATIIVNDVPALKGDGQDCGIISEVQDMNSRIADGMSVQRAQDRDITSKDNIIQSKELCKEVSRAKESVCESVNASGFGLQIDMPDDLQTSTNVETLELEHSAAPDIREFQLYPVVKGVVNDVQSDLIQNGMCGTGSLFSIEYLEPKETGTPGQRVCQRSTFEMPSAKVKVLLGHIVNLKICEHTADLENKQDSCFSADENNLILPLRYESPLRTFRSYRSCWQFTNVFHFSTVSSTWAHGIDPYKSLCKYEHRGKCNNDECGWQHKSDYVLNANQVLDQSHRYDVANRVMAMRDSTGRSETNDLCSAPLEFSDGIAFNKDKQQDGNIETSPVHLQKSAPSRMNLQITKAPIYRLGSYLVKGNRFASLLSLKHRSRFGQSLSIPLPVSRQVPIDMPCLLDSSVRFSTLGNGLTSSEQFSIGNRAQVEVEGYYSDSFEDIESLLEAALNLIDFDLNAGKSESQRNVLYLLSRGLEVKSSSVALWVVYLHLFYRWEKSLGKDDLFYHAVQHNMGSYELWMMFINTRGHLTERLEAYNAAIVALGSIVENQVHQPAGKSSFLLDLVLQMLNCMCVSGTRHRAVGWITGLTVFASEDFESLEEHDTRCASILLTCLTKHDLCILWVCCAYIILRSQLPSNIVERLGCKQELPLLSDIWQDNRIQPSCDSHAMTLMHVAASNRRGCLALDSGSSPDKDTQFSREALAVNFVQCAAVCEGFDSSLALADKFMNLFPSSIELILVRVNLEEHRKNKMAGLSIFEQALSQWPLHNPGKMRLWSQYIGYAVDVKGIDFVKGLVARCAAQVQYYSDRCSSLCEALGRINVPSLDKEPGSNHEGLQLSEQDLNNSVRLAFESIPSILNEQHSKGSEAFKQCFSNQDAVFGFLNLAFFEALAGDMISTNKALDKALKIATDIDDVQHCLKERAALIFFGPTNSKYSSAILLEHKMLNLFDRCFTETQLVMTVHPLSEEFCESIKRRRVRLFVSGLLGPRPTDNTLVNNILETIYGPTLLPEERVTIKELIDFVEKMMEVTPSNFRLAASACRAVQRMVDDFNAASRYAPLYWSAALLVNCLCQAPQEAPESVWLEGAKIVEELGADSLLEDFYQHALAAYPFSKALWNGLLVVSSRTGNSKIAVQSAYEKGVNLDVQPRS